MMCNSWHTHLCMSVHRWQCQTETLFHLLFQFPALKGCKFPLVWASSSRSCASVHLIWGNRALRLAPELARVTFSYVIRWSANPNQFPSISSLKTRCCACSVQQVSPVPGPDPTTLAPPAASARLRSEGTQSNAFITFDERNIFAELREYRSWVMMGLWFDLSVWTGYSLKK